MPRTWSCPIVIVCALLSGPALLAAARAAPRVDLVGSTPTPRHALHAAERTVWDSVYTAEQATRGQAAYNRTCARCHQPALGGADQSPALIGSAFLGNWNGLTLGAMHERIRTSMPTDDPGTYGRQHIADVMAYVLKVNGFPAGAVELPKESEALLEIRFQASKP